MEVSQLGNILTENYCGTVMVTFTYRDRSISSPSPYNITEKLTFSETEHSIIMTQYNKNLNNQIYLLDSVLLLTKVLVNL
jgi:hypothetical protein